MSTGERLCGASGGSGGRRDKLSQCGGEEGGVEGGGGVWGEYDVGAMTRGSFAWCMINFSKIISLVLYINCIKALTCEIFLSGALGWG